MEKSNISLIRSCVYYIFDVSIHPIFEFLPFSKYSPCPVLGRGRVYVVCAHVCLYVHAPVCHMGRLEDIVCLISTFFP